MKGPISLYAELLMMPVIHVISFDYMILSSDAKFEVFKRTSSSAGYLKQLFLILVWGVQ